MMALACSLKGKRELKMILLLTLFKPSMRAGLMYTVIFKILFIKYQSFIPLLVIFIAEAINRKLKTVQYTHFNKDNTLYHTLSSIPDDTENCTNFQNCPFFVTN